MFDQPKEELGNNAFAVQLEKLYRGISALETKILKEDAEEGHLNNGRIMVKGLRKEITNEDSEV